MKNLFIAVLLLVLFCAPYASAEVTYNQESKTYVQKADSAKTTKGSKAENTGYTYTDKEGNSYPIMIGAKGGVYVVKTSKKTGKPYNYYLPEDVQNDVRAKLGREKK